MINYKIISLVIVTLLSFNITFAKLNPGYNSQELINRDTVTPGVVYSYIKIGQKALKHSVHVVEIDLTKDSLNLCVYKAQDNNRGLDKLQYIQFNYDAYNHCTSVCGVNANFWRAITNFPIGPLVVDCQVVEGYRYKKWSSCFIDTAGVPYIDTFDIKTFVYHNNQVININRVNRRLDSNGIVLYNKYAGLEIPHVSDKDVLDRLESILSIYEQDSSFVDSTEVTFDTLQFKDSLRAMQRREELEFELEKAVLEYQDFPSINIDVKCVVVSVQTGVVTIPENGCVISYPQNTPENLRLKVGDIVSVKYQTNILPNKKFRYAVCGTPRLVRDGNPVHEAYQEGSKGRRFINKRLARTAIGYNKEKTKMYMVTVDANDSRSNVKGADLKDLSAIMRVLGCWDAMNLDGGGSSYMTINQKNIKYRSKPNLGRKVSAGIGVIKK
jgi:hypothetical protein